MDEWILLVHRMGHLTSASPTHNNHHCFTTISKRTNIIVISCIDQDAFAILTTAHDVDISPD